MKTYLYLTTVALCLQACSPQIDIKTENAAGSKVVSEGKYYSEENFLSVRKIDSHVHANVDSEIFTDVARENNFEILSINVDYPDFPEIDIQASVATKLSSNAPDIFHYAATFSMKGFGQKGWTDSVIYRVDQAVEDGAVAVKVWKNIGMVESDKQGKRIFLNDPRFSPLLGHLTSKNIPLIAHQGEPRNCWLPLDEMTTNNDRLYFSSHPEYYMYLQPEEPSYESLMSIRDEVVLANKDLIVIGAHLASLEWSVDKIGEFLDSHPNAVVDMAARMSEIQNQSNQDYTRVRDFFVKYQDRIIYGSDLTHNPLTEEMRQQNPPVTDDFASQANSVWKNDWRYLATEKSQFVGALQADSRGLKLPRSVLDKIYYENAVRVFNLKP